MGKIFFPLSQNFDILRHFGPQNDPILTIFTKNDLIWQHWPPIIAFLTKVIIYSKWLKSWFYPIWMPYFWPILDHFLALKTQNFRNWPIKTPQMAYRSKITTISGYTWIFRTFKLIFYSKWQKSWFQPLWIPYIWLILVHFLTLKTQNFRNGWSRTPQMTYIS